MADVARASRDKLAGYSSSHNDHPAAKAGRLGETKGSGSLLS